MSELTNIGNIRNILGRHGFRFSRALGQNFIVNPGLCPKIVEQSGITKDMGALEIGPGIGTLTKELSAAAKKVAAIELDRRLLPILRETLGGCPNVEIVHGDALTVDLHSLIREKFYGMDVAVCANLPYYITSQIIMRLLEERLPIRSVTVMVQKEAAQRLCAAMPSRQAGAVTAAVAFYAEAHMLFTVPKGSFMPAPEVESAVIRLDIRDRPAVEVPDEAAFFRVIKAAFGQRRKTLLNSLSAGMGLGKAETAAILAEAGVDPGLRAEQLSLEQFGRLSLHPLAPRQ